MSASSENETRKKRKFAECLARAATLSEKGTEAATKVVESVSGVRSTLSLLEDQSGAPPYYVKLPSHEKVDEIKIKVEERYKTSELSGDEWRFSVVTTMFFKGRVVKEFRTTSVEDAVNRFSENYREASSMFTYKEPEGTEKLCQSIGCKNEATVFYRLKKKFCNCGSESEAHSNWMRRFCAHHSTRGDCGLEDADRNYELVEGAGAQPVKEEVKSQSGLMIV